MDKVYFGTCPLGHEVISSVPELPRCGCPAEYDWEMGEMIITKECQSLVVLHEATAEELEEFGWDGTWPE